MSTRVCKKCNSNKPLEAFSKTTPKGESRRYECKSCVRSRHSTWRSANGYRQFKKDKCERCGFIPMHSCQLDVDHIDGDHKNDAIANLQTLCANCHRLKTFINKECRRDRR